MGQLKDVIQAEYTSQESGFIFSHDTELKAIAIGVVEHQLQRSIPTIRDYNLLSFAGMIMAATEMARTKGHETDVTKKISSFARDIEVETVDEAFALILRAMSDKRVVPFVKATELVQLSTREQGAEFKSKLAELVDAFEQAANEAGFPPVNVAELKQELQRRHAEYVREANEKTKPSTGEPRR